MNLLPQECVVKKNKDLFASCYVSCCQVTSGTGFGNEPSTRVFSFVVTFSRFFVREQESLCIFAHFLVRGDYKKFVNFSGSKFRNRGRAQKLPKTVVYKCCNTGMLYKQDSKR
jgi:hypothetical protein